VPFSEGEFKHYFFRARVITLDTRVGEEARTLVQNCS
jgi:hypothetical protein